MSVERTGAWTSALHVTHVGASRSSALRALGVVFPVVVAACGGEPASPPSLPPPAATLALRFEHRVDDEPLVVGEPATTRYGEVVRFGALRYWVSGVGLTNGKSVVAAPPDSFALVEETQERTRREVVFAGLPPGSYEGLVFHVGVDPAHDSGALPVTGELASVTGMGAPAEGGFVYLRADGTVERPPGMQPFSFSIGTLPLYKRLAVTFPEPIVLGGDTTRTLDVRAEVDRLFAGVSLPPDGVVKGGPVDSVAAQIAGNFARSFRLVGASGELPFAVSSPNVDLAPPDSDVPSDDTPPVLTSPLVELPAALSCGAVPGRPASDERGCVTPFLLAPGSTSPLDAGLLSFVVPNGTEVRAASSGLVWDVRAVGHSDVTHVDLFDVVVRPGIDSAFFLEYRNLTGVKVTEGAEVAPGQPLGAAADYHAEEFGLVSLALRRSQERTQRLCPTTFASPTWLTSFQAGLAASNAAWPTHHHDEACSSRSLLCTGKICEQPADFVAVGGDVDAGRRIYRSACASCHGEKGEGGVASALCDGATCGCASCGDHASLAARIDEDMPPEGQCDARCAGDVAAYILSEFAHP